MADVSAIKLPDNTTYNLVDNTSGYTKNTGTITSIKTTAGTHTAIDVASGAATFSVPTKTSHLTNDSGFMTEAIMIVTLTESGGTLTSDKTYTEIVNAISNGEMVYASYGAYLYAYDGENGGSYFFSSKVIESSQATQTDLTLNSSSGGVASWSKSVTTFTDSDQKLLCNAAVSGTTYYPILSASRATASTKFFDTTGITYKGTNGTTSTVGSAILTLGNNKASGTANNKQGRLVVYGSTAYAHTIQGAPTAARTLTLPDKAGTIALTSDINPGTVTSVQVQASGPITSSTSTAQSSTLNTTIGFSKPYVTEQNTGNGWTYRIWSNNTMEMWTTVTINAATNTSDAGGYKSASSATPQNFPITFAEIPVVQVTCDSNEVTGSITSAARPTTTSAGEWRLYRHSSNSNTSDKNFMFYVIGTKAS